MEEVFEKIEKVTVPALDEILGKKFPVLDDGFVRVIDYMGSDESIVQAARVSYGKGTKKISEDRGLIRYLMRNKHTTPFEMCEIKFHLRVPMDTWRQWIRHRTANVNEYSTRYSIAIDAAQKTEPNQWRLQSKDNKQGSDGYLDLKIGEKLSKREEELQNFAREVYQERLELGVAREQARKDLPLSTYTEAYWKIDLHNLLHFLALRMDTHAQYEIRSYAKVIGYEIVARWCPLAWEAFLDYQMNSITLSANEIKIINALVKNNFEEALKIAENLGWLNKIDNRLTKNRERNEFEEKLNLLGLDKPW
ncbi:MAG: FAD-dependent thymidylate synthase [Melioribacter sp.]|nr:FAD-dependent thymidylate synthase [Melioribacter sp.]